MLHSGIAAADAIGMALCVLAFFHVSKLAHQFVYEVDKSTLEVADYTIIVKGLPEVNPIDVSAWLTEGRPGGVTGSYLSTLAVTRALDAHRVL
jgi:hypothetical protein